MNYPPPPPPPPPDYFRASDHEGALLVIRVKEYNDQYSAWTEPQPAVRCDVEVIEPAAGPWYDAWIGNNLLVAQLKDAIGQTYFSRLGKKGQAYVLEPIRPGDEDRVDQWRQDKRSGAEQPAASASTAATYDPHRDVIRRARVDSTPSAAAASHDVPF